MSSSWWKRLLLRVRSSLFCPFGLHFGTWTNLIAKSSVEGYHIVRSKNKLAVR